MRNMVCLLAALTFVCAAPAHATLIFSGSLSSANGGLDGSGLWVNPGNDKKATPATVTWTIKQNLDGSWNYAYSFSVYKSDVSHVIIETSSSFTMANIFNASGGSVEIGTFGPDQGNSNPNMPSELYGIKFDSTSGTTLTVKFDSNLAPTWGDFYAKGGKTGGDWNAIWDEGFARPDPGSPVSSGTFDNHILVPGGSIPEPATLSALALGGAVLLRRTRR